MPTILTILARLTMLTYLRCLLAAREYQDVERTQTMASKIGQAVYEAPNVFNFFRPDYAPEGAVQAAGLVSPKGQLITTHCS